jgi:hypothetical protein
MKKKPLHCLIYNKTLKDTSGEIVRVTAEHIVIPEISIVRSARTTAWDMWTELKKTGEEDGMTFILGDPYLGTVNEEDPLKITKTHRLTGMRMPNISPKPDGLSRHTH